MRDRAWRKYKQDIKVIKRLSKLTNGYWRRYKDVNGIMRDEPIVQDFIGSSYNFMYKTYTTSSDDSKYKSKYSSNSKNSWYRDGDNRERQKVNFLNILKEYGII